ncbi:MAG TPA: asparagine synthase (glutamine-hydrolyzing) [Gemmatimonadaceae bacterium]|nr:asparagine synthase (glutamine-hydrolyzing) [Gemmatimonadaceae bacterium]
MCGICGLANASPERPVDERRLVAMRDVIAHRGPDGVGIHCAAGVGLGHRRLSIIDVEGGAQPLSNEDGTVWVSFNGEIYNYAELTQRLVRLGHRFRTHSDTEVLVHAYEEFGDEFVRELNGMFAFAIHDLRRNRVLLARDHLGIKPLFYAQSGESLVFASEIKAVLAGLGTRPRLRPEALQEYLIFRYIAGSGSFFEGVSRLPAGHIAVWEKGTLAVRPYWNPPSGRILGASSLEDAAEEVERLLVRSVESQMMSEVPLGSYCSGGVDSGLVTGYASKASPHRLQTFAVGFRDPAWDESALAAGTAKHFGTDHHTVFAEPGEFLDLLDKLVWFNDEPLSHPNAIPLYQLSRVARQSVTVVLTGEGADELFCGYPRYHIARVREALEGLPASARRLLAAGARRSPGHRAAKLADLVGRSVDDGLILNSAYVAPEVVARLTGAPVDGALTERRRLLAEARVSDDDVETLSRYELRTYLGCALDRMDRMSMACSLEGRVPFLDIPLVEHAVRMPTRLKLGRRTTKRVLKQLARRELSADVAGRSKSGFGVPLGDWFRSPVLSPAMDRLRDPSHPAAQYFDRSEIDRLVCEHATGQADHGESLWLLANVYAWQEAVVEGSPRSFRA